MIPTLCAASLLPLHLYREGTHAESDTASPLFSESHQKKCSPLHQALQRAATANAAACNERGSAMNERQQLHIIYRSAEQRTAKRQDTGTKAWLLSDYMLTFALREHLDRKHY